MEPKFQTSFIPKKPVSSSPPLFSSVKSPSNIFYIGSVILFVIALILCAGLFGYKYILNKDIVTANDAISKTRDDLQPDTIKELLRHNDRITYATKILNNHIILYPMFAELQSLIYKNVSFGNFLYYNKDNIINLSSGVIAKNYNALAQQSLAFANSKYISNSVFSDFGLTEDGNISAKFTLNLDPSLVSYKMNSDNSNISQ